MQLLAEVLCLKVKVDKALQVCMLFHECCLRMSV